MTGKLRVLAAPLGWLLVMFSLAAPLALSNRPNPAGPHTATSTHVLAAIDASTESTGSPDDDTDGSSGVLGLPPRVHLVVNRTGTGTAPPAPVPAVLTAPVGHTDAGIRIAADRAGTASADAPPANSHWGRAPPRAFA